MSAYVYHTESAEGDVGIDCASIAEAMAGFKANAANTQCLDDWQDGTTNGGKPCQTATITFHDRPCAIMVRVETQPAA